MSVRSSFQWGKGILLVTPEVCCVSICTNSKHVLKPPLCCAFYWRQPCHDHPFDLLCFHMYKLQAYFETTFMLRILLEKAMPWPHLRFVVFSYVQTPIKLQFYAAEEVYSCRAQKKKFIWISFKILLHLMAWPGPIGFRFEQGFDWGLYIWKTSMPELWHFTCSCHCKFFDWTRIPGLFGVCTYENTACQRSGSQRAFLECLRGGLMLAYVAGSFAQTVCEHLGMAGPCVSQEVWHSATIVCVV